VTTARAAEGRRVSTRESLGGGGRGVGEEHSSIGSGGAGGGVKAQKVSEDLGRFPKYIGERA